MVFAAPAPTLAVQGAVQSRAEWIGQGQDSPLLTTQFPVGFTLLAWALDSSVDRPYVAQYQGVISPADFAYGTDPQPHTYIQPQDAGTYMLRLQMRFAHLSGTDDSFKATNAYMVEVYKDTADHDEMVLLGRGLAAVGGGFVTVTAFFRLSNTEVTKEYIVLAVNHIGNDSHVGVAEFFDLSISKLF